jgi:hypothetical protein
MKRITRDFAPADRYLYDFKILTTAKGWAQIDTRQDANYYGQWINPAKRQIFCYCEGDLILTEVDTDAELVTEVESIKTFHDNQGYPFLGIDPGFNEGLKSKLAEVGLAAFLH